MLGIAITLLLIALFLMTMYFYSQFFQIIAFKIRIIMRNTVSKGADFKGLYFPLRNPESNTELYSNLEIVYRREVVKRKNFQFRNVFMLLLERFHYIMYLPFRNKVLDKLILLRPPTSFYYMMNLTNFMFLWSIAILITGAQLQNGIELSSTQAIGWSILVALLGSLITFIVTLYAHRYYAKEVKRVFYREIEEEQDRIYKLADMQINYVQENNMVDEQTEIQNSENSVSEDAKQNIEESKQQNEDLVLDEEKLEAKGKYNSKNPFQNAAKDKIIPIKNPNKERSILQMHSKRLNALKHLMAIKLEGEAKKKNKKATGQNFYGAIAMSITGAGFFKEQHNAKYKLGINRESVGDDHLFVSELKRSNTSKVNIINLVLIPFIILSTGL